MPKDGWAEYFIANQRNPLGINCVTESDLWEDFCFGNKLNSPFICPMKRCNIFSGIAGLGKLGCNFCAADQISKQEEIGIGERHFVTKLSE